LRYLFSRHISILGSYVGSKAELYPVLDVVSRGLVKPVIDTVMPLENAKEAHHRLERRQQFGKVVLRID
jgi:D-arabinose 1-dehydrogenase-like Zn-dependent alcohol dehydrogenase